MFVLKNDTFMADKFHFYNIFWMYCVAQRTLTFKKILHFCQSFTECGTFSRTRMIYLFYPVKSLTQF